MQGQARDVEGLRAYIAALEKRPLIGGSPVQSSLIRWEANAPSIHDLTAAPAGLLQEVFTDEERNGGAALGFALGLSRTLLTPSRPAILYLQMISGTQEIGVPYALGLSRFGIEPHELILGCLDSLTDLFWALEEAIACQAVAAIIADVTGTNQQALDFTVSRRLSLRAVSAGTSAFLLRYGTGREASAAKLRWRVAPMLSQQMPFDAQAPGPPRFTVTLEKSRLGTRAQRLEGQTYDLDWVDHGFAVVERGDAERIVQQRLEAPSRFEPAALGHRLSQAS
jgi:protein ImuA